MIAPAREAIPVPISEVGDGYPSPPSISLVIHSTGVREESAVSDVVSMSYRDFIENKRVSGHLESETSQKRKARTRLRSGPDFPLFLL